MPNKKTLILIVRILEECFEHEYSSDELRGKIRDILRLLGVSRLETPRDYP